MRTRTLFTICATALVAFSVMSCQKSNEENAPPPPQLTEEQAYDALVADLAKLNTETFGESYALISDATRAPRWWRWIGTAFADAATALITKDLLQSIVASVEVWRMQIKEAQKNGVSIPSDTKTLHSCMIDHPSLNVTTYNAITAKYESNRSGFIHNFVIFEVLCDNSIPFPYGDRFTRLPPKDFILRLTHHYKIQTKDYIYSKSPETILSNIEPILFAYDCSENLEYFCMNLDKFTGGEHMLELRVFLELMTGFQNVNTNTSLQYANSTLNIIRASHLPNASKQAISNAVAVAHGGIRFWNEASIQGK